MVTAKKIPERVIFPKGEKIAGEKIANGHFTGSVWLHVLVPDDSTFHCPAFNVTFEPCARNNWHKHPGGQILLVTGGKGYYQEAGRNAQVIREGDVVMIHPCVKHWHGAAPDHWLSHIAISTNVQRGEAAWLEPVPDEEYRAIRSGE
ncbi:MAG: cupin domain-containing protein [Methanoregula sp.]|jgi:quercetin dioxygenase-like cupin family protein|uniref:cupin domain-containing protein n=1 Tax=Methanoregula sp. TaxID=2052170 RepID=UPI003C220200